MAELTDREAEVYDRQIRLWGVDAQRRMRSSNVLIVGMGALGAEVAKNIFLAGINVTVADACPAAHSDADAAPCAHADVVSAVDVASSFFLDAACIGQPRAAASLPRLRELNPMATASQLDGCVQRLRPEELQQYALVILCNAPLHLQHVMTRACHAASVPVLSTTMCGFWSFLFVDFGEAYTYSTEVTKKEGAAPELSTHTIRYPSLDAVLRRPWGEYPKRERAAPHAGFFAWNALMQAHLGLTDDVPGAHSSAAELCDAVAQVRGEAAGMPPAKSADVAAVLAQCNSTLHVEIVPVCAIMGGMIGQEVVKLLSRKDAPIHNVFVFDAMGGTGGVVVNAAVL